MRLRPALNIATEWHWKMMKGGVKRTNSAPWCGMEASERGGETVPASPALGAGQYAIFLTFIMDLCHVLCVRIYFVIFFFSIVDFS